MLEAELRRELEAEDFVAEGFAAGEAGADGAAPRLGEAAAELGTPLAVLDAGLDPGLPLIAETLAAACLH